MKYLLSISLLILSYLTFAIEPEYSIKASANVTDMVYHDNTLYIASDNGVVEIFDIKNKRIVKSISLPKIIDFFGEEIAPKIFDIDYNPKSNELLIVSQANGGFSNVFLYKSKLKQIIDKDNKMMIKRALYYSDNEIILGLLSNEIIRFSISEKKEIYRTQISAYTFSDMCLSQKGGRIISSDESGRLNISNAHTGEVILIYKGENLNNVYQIDYKGKTIATAGQDRRLGIYHVKPYLSFYIESQFLIYAVSLSSSGKRVAFSANEDNDIKILDSYSKKEIVELHAHNALINTIIFTSENSLFTAADEQLVYYWKF